MKSPERVLILGLGNLLCGDDAFGVLAAARLYERFDFPANVEIMDGGTQGQTLYGLVEEADRLLVLDATDFGGVPGSMKVLRNGEVPMWLGKGKLSPHQDSFAELLALASLKNSLPEEIALIGMQPGKLAFGEQSDAEAGIEEAMRLAMDILAEWDIFPSPAQGEKHLLNSYMAEAFSGSRR